MNKYLNFTKQLLLISVVLFAVSCATTHDLLIADVISFSEDVHANYTGKGNNQTAPYVIHTDKVKYDSNAAKALKTQIKTAPRGVNTSIAYALDLGLDRIKYIRSHQLKNDKTAEYYTILVTDGLDNTSVDVARNNQQGNYSDLKAYQKSIQEKAKKVMGSGKETNLYQIYPMLMIGSDLTMVRDEQMPDMSDEDFANFCAEGYMKEYEGASVGWKAPKALAAYSFAKLADEFKEIFALSGFEFYIPKGYKGKHIKMNLVDEEGNKASFEGDVVKKGNDYWLKNIRLNDQLVLRSAKNKQVFDLKQMKGDKKDIRAWFRMENLKLNDKTFKVDKGQVAQYYKEHVNGREIWQYNSEYNKNAKPQVDRYVQFIFDTSQSMDDKAIKEEQNMLIDIFNIITEDLR